MQWFQIRLKESAKNEEMLSEILTQLGAASVTTEAANAVEVFEVDGEITDSWSQIYLTALFDESVDISEVCAQLASQNKAQPQISLVKDQDWESLWQVNFQPLKISSKLWVHASWHDVPDPNAVNLIIDPGMAFGTGTHESTQLCLVLLDQLNLTGLEILDYGCGSGILAIGALKLGAAKVIAVDIDPRALLATQKNAQHNNIQIETYLPHELPTSTRADLVIANILAQTILELKEHLQSHLKSGGKLLLSGILSHQADTILRAFPELSWQTSHNGDWVALLSQVKPCSS